MAASALALGLQTVRADVVVYQNTTGLTANFLNATSYEVGDEIILANGYSGPITSFAFQYTLNGLDAQARVRFYQNNGPLSSGYSSPGAAAFFDSGLFGINAGTHNVTFTSDLVGILVPDHFTWSVQFFGTTDSGGPDIFDSVTAGGNYNDYWDNDGSSWTLRQSTNGLPINLGAQIEAVPEPSTIALGILEPVLNFSQKLSVQCKYIPAISCG